MQMLRGLRMTVLVLNRCRLEECPTSRTPFIFDLPCALEFAFRHCHHHHRHATTSSCVLTLDVLSPYHGSDNAAPKGSSVGIWPHHRTPPYLTTTALFLFNTIPAPTLDTLAPTLHYCSTLFVSTDFGVCLQKPTLHYCSTLFVLTDFGVCLQIRAQQWSSTVQE